MNEGAGFLPSRDLDRRENAQGLDFTTWTVKLRKGAKWSDGSPFTADDILFWYADVLLNKDLTPALPTWMRNRDGSPVAVEKVDDYTVRWVYREANTTFLLELANKDSGDRVFAVFLPSKYLKQFHPKHTDKAQVDRMATDARFRTWVELFAPRTIRRRIPSARRWQRGYQSRASATKCSSCAGIPTTSA